MIQVMIMHNYYPFFITVQLWSMAVRATPYIECLDGKILSESFFKAFFC